MASLTAFLNRLQTQKLWYEIGGATSLQKADDHLGSPVFNLTLIPQPFFRSSRQNLAETTPQPSPSEYVYLKDEIDKLKDQLERQQHENNHRPIIRASSGIESSTNFEDSEFETRSSRKTNSIFSKLRKEIKGLREDLYKIATPKNRFECQHMTYLSEHYLYKV